MRCASAERLVAAQGEDVAEKPVGVAGLRLDLELAVRGRLRVQSVASRERRAAEGEVVDRRAAPGGDARPDLTRGRGAPPRRRAPADGAAGDGRRHGERRLRRLGPALARMREASSKRAQLLVRGREEVDALSVELVARDVVRQVVDDVLGVPVRELLVSRRA